MFIVEKNPKSIVVESYKTLRTNIQYSSFDKKYKVIAITSSEPGEGKSTACGNLAICLAQEKNKVLLIDCDLRRPSLHKEFKISNLSGLSDVLLGKKYLDEIVHKHNENLDVLPSGKIPPNPSEMLSSKVMSKLLEELKKEYDYVILDTPPVLLVTDAQILSTKVDGTILVIRAEKTKKQQINKAIGLLKIVNGNLIGTILNDLYIKKKAYNYYYGEK